MRRDGRGRKSQNGGRGREGGNVKKGKKSKRREGKRGR
jgi:hypothetical protein